MEMPKYKVEIGGKVDVLRQKNTKDVEESSFLSSKVIDKISDTVFVITMPMAKTVTVPLAVGEEIGLYFYASGFMLSSIAVVKERYREGALLLARIEFLSELQKMQRRQYYRISCSLPTHFYTLSFAEKSDLLKLESLEKNSLKMIQMYNERVSGRTTEWDSGTIIDLSGGGVKMVTERLLNKGETLLMIFKLKIGQEINEYKVLIKVIAVEKKLNVMGKFEVRAKFHKILDSYRDSIVRFVFEEERLNLNKTNLD